MSPMTLRVVFGYISITADPVLVFFAVARAFLRTYGLIERMSARECCLKVVLMEQKKFGGASGNSKKHLSQVEG